MKLKRCALILGIFLIGVTLTAPPVLGQYFGRNKVQYQNFDFSELQTNNFNILFYDEEEAIIPDVARMTERWHYRISNAFNHTFAEGERKPLIFYANDADFRQTNIVPGFIPGGVRGLTEPLRERVVMPLTSDHAISHQVLGHELVHSFQYDIGLREPGFRMGELPLWLVEGMAEYYSLGMEDVQTSMFMRDAILNDNLPDFSEISNQAEYNPYRFGHSFMAHIGGTYSDQAGTDLFKASGMVGIPMAMDSVLLDSTEAVFEAWHTNLVTYYEPLMENRTPPDEVGERVLAQELGHGQMNIAPALSPDGRYVTYLSESLLFQFDMFVADAETGEEVANLGTVADNPHIDQIRFLTSGGSWSPDGQRVAFISFAKGINNISIWNIETGEIEENIRLPSVPALQNPAWSPDGNKIAVTGVSNGFGNLYVYDLETGETEQLTDDVYTVLQPAWSPDGSIIAIYTDAQPGGTDFESLDLRPGAIGLIDVETGETEYINPFGPVTHHNPQFSSDGESVFFIAGRDGFMDVYRHDLITRETFQVTNIQTGVTGVTELSPTLAVSRDTGLMMFSVFSEGRYSIASLDESETEGVPIDLSAENTSSPGAMLPPVDGLDGLVETYLDNPSAGLPPLNPSYDISDHNRSLGFTSVIGPQAGVGIGGGSAFGTQVAGGVGFLFTDLLNDRNLGVSVQARGTFRDIGGQLSYINRANRFNYGAAAGRTPLLYTTSFLEVDQETGNPMLNRVVERIHIDQANLMSEYPVSRTRRWELSLGVSRYGFGRRSDQYLLDQTGSIVLDRERVELDAPDDLYFATGSLAYVTDFSHVGFTSPLAGGRSRYQVSPRIGTSRYVSVMADARRYLLAGPITFAGRLMHLGNYGADQDDAFATEYLGYAYSPSYVRGYSFASFAPEECPGQFENCPSVDRLRGTHTVSASVEVRLPFLGIEELGLINFPWVPTDLAIFGDAGLAWSADDTPELRFDRDSNERIPVFSAGVSSRFNLLGALVIELYYAYPFQRPERGGHFGLQFIPGW
ncbi:MAG: hypothetical protein WD038_04205 [Balneolales bacterium]